MTKEYIPVLTIAGSDCSGGAGIQADIKTMSALGCYAMSAITAITAQNTTGVSAVEGVSPQMVAEQIRMVFADIPPRAIKTGMLFSAEIIAAVAYELREHQAPNLVVDPVMVSTSGSKLISDSAIRGMTEQLFPLALLVTPNRHEAEALSGSTDREEQARAILAMGPKAVLIKGGDDDMSDVRVDLLACRSGERIEFSTPTIFTPNTHGTGCTLSSAIASRLALGDSLSEAVGHAKEYITGAIRSGVNYRIGSGHGPVDHFWQCR